MIKPFVMKIKTIVWVCLLMVNLSFAAPKTIAAGESILQNEQLIESKAGKCTINISIELEDGTIIEGVVTISGDEMNFLKCIAIKIYDFFSSDF